MISPSDSNATPDIIGSIERATGGAARRASTSEQHEAQERVYDAMEAATIDDALGLIFEALDLDPRNVDAWLMLVGGYEFSPDERIEVLRKLVDMAAANLGKEIMKEKGIFWGFLETRPYMRARAELACAFVEAGRVEEAVAEYEGMLELNPNDNQGNRYFLMGLYLQLGRLDGARDLFEKYDERGFSAIWAWGYVLERHIAGAEDEAVLALAQARKQNGMVEVYLKDRRRMPKRILDRYSPGSSEEATICVDALFPAWRQHPRSLAWLKRQTVS
jgi:tetratricopeptide (TPR) repeat protein